MAAGFKTATVASGDVPSTQTDFPAYVDLSRLGITTLAEAQSVRVYADSGKTTEWAREIVSATEMHVKIPSLTSTTDIYVDWDGTSSDYAVTDTYGRNAVWSGYRGVYHLNSDGTDSTGNGYTLTVSGSPAFGTQKVGNGVDFGSNLSGTKYLRYASGLMGFSSATSDFSYSVWAKFSTLPGASNVSVISHRMYGEAAGTQTRWQFYNNAGTIELQQGNDAGTASAKDTTTNSTGTWYHFASTKSGTTGQLYRDGSTVGTTGSYSGTVNYSGYPDEITLGASRTGGNQGFAGTMDEFRVTNTAFSADWITTEYNNQSDEAGFWGTWSDVGGGGSPDTTKFFALMH